MPAPTSASAGRFLWASWPRRLATLGAAALALVVAVRLARGREVARRGELGQADLEALMRAP